MIVLFGDITSPSPLWSFETLTLNSRVLFCAGIRITCPAEMRVTPEAPTTPRWMRGSRLVRIDEIRAIHRSRRRMIDGDSRISARAAFLADPWAGNERRQAWLKWERRALRDKGSVPPRRWGHGEQPNNKGSPQLEPHLLC